MNVSSFPKKKKKSKTKISPNKKRVIALKLSEQFSHLS